MLLLSNQLSIRDIKGLLLSCLCSSMSLFLSLFSFSPPFSASSPPSPLRVSHHNPMPIIISRQSCNLEHFARRFILVRTHLPHKYLNIRTHAAATASNCRTKKTICTTAFSATAGQLEKTHLSQWKFPRQFLADSELCWSSGYLKCSLVRETQLSK